MAKTKWQVKREASYDALVDAAMRAFHDRGYAATRIEDIVADTAYTSGAFYLHFRNKQDCFWHVLEHRERLRGDWQGVVAEHQVEAEPLEVVITHALQAIAASMKDVEAWVLVMVDFFQQHRGDPEVAIRLQEFYGRWRDELMRFVLALQQGGWVDRQRDPRDLSMQLFAFAEGLTVHSRVFGLDESRSGPALVDGLCRLLRGA